MKRIIPTLAILTLAAVAFGEAATQPTTQPERKKYVAANPAIEAIIKSLPKSLMLPTNGAKTDLVEQGKKMREWDAKNADGKPISAVGYLSSAQVIYCYLPDGTEVHVAMVGKPDFQFDKTVLMKFEGKIGKGGFRMMNNFNAIQYSFALVDVKATKVEN